MRKIESLSDHEHLLLRPNAYVGSTESMEDKIIIYDTESKYFVSKNKVFSEGFYRIFDEVLDNAFDEARRCFSEGYHFDKIIVAVNSENNEVKISDSGRGFIDGEQLNEKTGMTNIETALTKLRAGSNFRNTDYKVSIIGMNGIGVSATNILSDVFEVETRNSKITYKQRWEKFVSAEKVVEPNKSDDTFTSIRFIPRKEIFKNAKYDFEILFSKLLFRKFQINNDDELKDIDIEFIFNGDNIDLSVNLFPENHVRINLNKNLTSIIWEVSDPNMCNISFVNSSQCSGFHQKYIEEYVNDKIFGNDTANQFYRSLVMVNLKPKYVQFQEQNKNRFVTTRAIMEKILPLKIAKIELDRVKSSETFKKIQNNIQESENKKHVKKIKKNKSNAFKFSDKFLSSTKKENIFLTEGNSASSACAQKRNANTDAIYTLRGKIKNTRDLADLTNSPIIVEMINILGLSLEDGGSSCAYKKIIIASDKDYDGNSIAGLIINFFHKWFPKIITDNKLFLLNSPLITYEVSKEVKYLYSLSEYESIPKTAKNIRYLKGLGSLSKDDWSEVFKKLPLIALRGDANTSRNLDIAFGDDIKRRKRWLTN